MHTCHFTSFGEFLPTAENQEFQLIGDDTMDSSGRYICHGHHPRFYVGNNPRQSSSQTSFIYNVTMEPMGWVGTYDNPTSRFQSMVKFETSDLSDQTA